MDTILKSFYTMSSKERQDTHLLGLLRLRWSKEGDQCKLRVKSSPQQKLLWKEADFTTQDFCCTNIWTPDKIFHN